MHAPVERGRRPSVSREHQPLVLRHHAHEIDGEDVELFVNSDSDVVAALESLGYTASEARRAAGAVAGTQDGLDARIRAALQELARSR